MFLIDRAGVLQHANSAGTETLQRAQYLVLHDGHVRPRTAKQKQQFANMLASVLSDDSITRASGQSASMSILDVQGQAAVLVAQTLRGQLNLCGKPQADAALFLIRPTEKAHINNFRLQIMFCLTPAETRLAEYLIRGMNLAAVSGQLHLSRETLKSQLRSLFEKTRTNRQGELIALLLSSLTVSVA